LQVEVQRLLVHPNIIQLYGVVTDIAYEKLMIMGKYHACLFDTYSC